MFKKFILFFLIVIIALIIASDRRTSRSEFLKKAVSEYNANEQNKNNYIYTPIDYTEVITDTIIENKVMVHIKNYSLMGENDVISTGNIHKLEYQRSFESEVVVYNNQGIWFKTILNAKTFPDNNYSLFWDNATLQHAWVNQEESNGNNVSILVSFVNPYSKSYRLYELTIDETGKYKTSLKENFI